MADDRLRDLYREWQATRTDDDGRAYVHERLRFDPDFQLRLMRHLIRLERAVMSGVRLGSVPETTVEQVIGRGTSRGRGPGGSWSGVVARRGDKGP